MSQSEFDQDRLAQSIREALDEQIAEPDELTRARLRAARYRALDHMQAQAAPWWSLLWSRWSAAAAGATCAVLLAWQMQVGTPAGEGVHQAEDAALIADLDLVMWLEDGGV
ncbi:MAG: hypothetical protein EVA65_08225 [Oceanococcus sp.]|nr:MAG: hypothetical protein EVA65_08225 [Oceanococcus sp.]